MLKKSLFLILIILAIFVFSAQSREITFEQCSVVEASAIVCLSNGDFITVDDERGIFKIKKNSKAELMFSPQQYNFLDDLEGIAISSDNKSIYTLSENHGEISKIVLSEQANIIRFGNPKLIGRLPKMSDKSNKGWEGICIVKIDGVDRLLAIHQKSPKLIGMFDLETLKTIAFRKLPKPIKKEMKNLSDLTYDKRTGCLLILSGKSRKIIELKLDFKNNLKILQTKRIINIPDCGAGKPEGLCFDNNGKLVIVTDGGGKPGVIIRMDN